MNPCIYASRYALHRFKTGKCVVSQVEGVSHGWWGGSQVVSHDKYKAIIYLLLCTVYTCMCMTEPVIIYGQTVFPDCYLHMKNMKGQLYFDPREVNGRGWGGFSE